MSTHQQTNPRRANQSITEESGRPGTVRSNVGCEAIDEPWTNSTAGLPSGDPANFSHRKRRTPPSSVAFVVQCSTPVTGVEHWTHKGEVRLFLWEKFVGTPAAKPAILFVHGSSMASQPTFDLSEPGRADSSVMDWFARRGFVCWCVDMEGYGRSDKTRDIYCDISNGADDLAAATDYIAGTRGVRSCMAYGISSGALRAALFAQRYPDRIARLALDAFVWTGEGAPTLVQRRKKLPEFLAAKRRPIDRAFIYSIFARDHPDCAEQRVVDAFADAILALDDSVPTGTYVDM